MSRAARIHVALVPVVLWLAAGAQAQPAEDSEGRALFRRGVEAADAGDWDAALEAFHGAYERLREPSVLLNLASSEVRAGRLVAAVHDYAHFLAGCAARGDERLCEAAGAAMHEALGRVPRLRTALPGI